MRISDWSSDVCSSDLLQHNRRYRIRHRIQQCVAIFETESSLAHVLVERDLDIDLIVGTIDARTIVDKVRVDPPAVQCVGDAPCLRNAQIGSFADHLRAQLLSRSEEHTSELQSLMRISYAVFCL